MPQKGEVSVFLYHFKRDSVVYIYVLKGPMSIPGQKIWVAIATPTLSTQVILERTRCKKVHL